MGVKVQPLMSSRCEQGCPVNRVIEWLIFETLIMKGVE